MNSLNNLIYISESNDIDPFAITSFDGYSSDCRLLVSWVDVLVVLCARFDHIIYILPTIAYARQLRYKFAPEGKNEQ